MKEVILLLADVVNEVHDLLMELSNYMGLQLTDKDLHFWIIGFIGIITFLFVYVCFKLLENVRGKITIFSFIYTFTVMVVLVFAIEIQQAITNRGNMEFADAVIGLWGFIVFFMMYIVMAIMVYFIKKFTKRKK
ncbi:hypothetical protein [Aquibacillus albus]|uniref:Membrane protein n=1 Tax=Aquibacillus albus TaxID=1168171 RepID=A0ABS2MW17_9BACI|nr:putative membrane protein [Aquibacillus albus]